MSHSVVPPYVVNCTEPYAECVGYPGGAPHPAEPIHVNVNSWTDCPQCSARYQINTLWRDEYKSDTPRDELGLPEFLEIEPIHSCNLRCVMCHVSYEQLTKSRLDPKFVKKLDGMQGKWAIVGGEYEPMTHPDIVEILTGLSAQGMKLDLTSNGTLFTPENIAAIAPLRLLRVTISFDGATKKTYETVRRRANFDDAIARILAFKTAVMAHNPDCRFTVNYTVLKENIGEMADAVEFWEGHGFAHIGFIGMVVRDDNEYLRDQSISGLMDEFQAQVDEAARRILDKRLKISISNSLGVAPTFSQTIRSNVWGHVVLSSNPDAWVPINPRPEYQNGAYPGMPVDCRSPYKAVRLWFDGTLRVCSKFTIGSIYEAPSFKDVWFGAQATKIRGSFAKKPEICYSCDYYRFCINAGRIDYSNPKNFVYLRSNDPANLGTFAGRQMMVWLDRLYSMRIGTANFDPRFDDAPQDELFEEAAGIEAARALFERLAAEAGGAPQPSPTNRHSIWKIGGAFWSVGLPAENDGVVRDLEIRHSPDYDRLVRAIADGTPALPPPRLAGQVGDYNIVQYGADFFGIPHSLGAFEIDKVDLKSIPEIVFATRYDKVAAEIERRLGVVVEGAGK